MKCNDCGLNCRDLAGYWRRAHSKDYVNDIRRDSPVFDESEIEHLSNVLFFELHNSFTASSKGSRHLKNSVHCFEELVVVAFHQLTGFSCRSPGEYRIVVQSWEQLDHLFNTHIVCT